MSSKFLIVGLGNIGPEYALTRHTPALWYSTDWPLNTTSLSP